MFDDFKEQFGKIIKSRTLIIAIVFFALFGVIIYRLFNLQIVNGENYVNDFNLKIMKERTINSTRGKIYDRNGNVLADNILAYNVTIKDNGTYESTKEKNLTLNSIAYKLIQILENNGDSIIQDFKVIIDETNGYSYSVTETSLLRFKADVYGHSLITDLKDEEKNKTAEEMMEYLSSSKGYGLVDEDYTSADFEAYNLPETFTKEEILKIVTIRYAISNNSYQKYVSTKIANDINDTTVAVISENLDYLQGVEIVEDYLRTYNDSVYFSSIIGYTGTVSAAELESLKEENEDYEATDIVGKSGIEYEMETVLQGEKGKETLYVDNLGKELETISKSKPQAGNDIYLTIDRDLQIATYKMLEQRIAGVLYDHLVNVKTWTLDKDADASDIRTPIYDVYYALVNNSVIDISHFTSADASSTEQKVQSAFESKQASVFAEITAELTSSSALPYKELNEEMQVYFSYIVNTMLMNDTHILIEEAIDVNDETYLNWKDSDKETISLQEFLTYAISKNWIDITSFTTESKYMDSNEVYSVLAEHITEYLKTDIGFTKKIYKYLILDDNISGTDLSIILFDQGILEENEDDYNQLLSSSSSFISYSFLRSKIKSLEITPAQLALYPCSGSAVVEDPNTGEVLACVTYPGYDNNLLANNMDSTYYNKLNSDLSTPFYNKATQQLTAPGSTFKPITGIAGATEGEIGLTESINCDGVFDLLPPNNINCWISPGSHGDENLEEALGDSCNVYFATLGFEFSYDTNELNNSNDNKGLEILKTYARMFGLGETSGIELSESEPKISDLGVAPSAIGQGTNNYATVQLAKYVSGLATSGTVYDLTLLDKRTDYEGNVLEDYEPVLYNQIDTVSQGTWDSIHKGMNIVTTKNPATKDLSEAVAGKTGTAQENKTRPNHALFIGYAPYDNPKITVAVRIANGYNSVNAAAVASDIFNYYFDWKVEEELITGLASDPPSSLDGQQTTD